jgi:DDT domain/WSTF, HB1, Itc1p, MBD9 motif 1
VKLYDRPDDEALVDDKHITRERKVFSKAVLRSFIKNTVSREAWNGAPWLVKDAYAQQYKIEDNVPPHLRRAPTTSEKRAMAKADAFNGMSSSSSLPALMPAKKGANGMVFKHQSQPFVQQQQSVPHHMFINYYNQPIKLTPPDNSNRSFAPLAARNMPPRPPPPPPIKYPIEDLEIPPTLNIANQRPGLKYVSEMYPVATTQLKKQPDNNSGIDIPTVGLLLEIWDTLNVYCEIYVLDSFTFDDFVDAMQFRSDEIECELLVETHCSVLKILVGEGESGNVEVKGLPELPEDESEDEFAESEKEPSPEPTPEPQPTRRSARKSLQKVDEQQAEEDAKKAAEPVKLHNAAEMMENYGWVDRARKRDFSNGGWEIILVGLLHQLSLDKRKTAACEEILAQLAPPDQEATQETARLAYQKLDINLRVKALEIICMLSLTTKAIREYMEVCAEGMTESRKEKIDWQRKRKAA